VEVRPLAVAPRQIPYRQGTLYFQLDTTGQHWKYLENSGAIALHLNGEFPGLEMELWAIKG
jgi:type VI secretion system protein ImpJ